MKPGYVLFFISVVLLMSVVVDAQDIRPVKHFERNNFSEQDSLRLLNEYGKNKELIPKYALQTLIALSYFPELKLTHVRFVLKHAHSPFTTRPVFPSVMSKGNKRYFTVTISDSTEPKLQPITLAYMDFNAQIGIIGHELSHVSDFSKRSLINLTGSGIAHLSSNYIDRFEYATDSICIEHGLGYQLLAWSIFVRETLQTKNYRGADNINQPMNSERYMNPETIMQKIKNDSLYSGL